MDVNITFEHNSSYLDLLLAFKAISPSGKHSKIIFTDEQLGELQYNTIVNSVIYRPKDKKYYFHTDNISIGEVEEVFTFFLCGFSQKLEDHNWLSKYPKKV